MWLLFTLFFVSLENTGCGCCFCSFSLVIKILYVQYVITVHSVLCSSKKYCILLFSALSAAQVARVADTKRPELKFALAGRSRDKLVKTLETARANTGLELADVPLVVADVNDNESLVAMARQARVVINCVGPVSGCGSGQERVGLGM